MGQDSMIPLNSNRFKLKIFFVAILIIAFLGAVVTSFLFIMEDADLLPNRQKFPNVKSGVLTPEFIPDSVAFASKEEVRRYTPPEVKKQPQFKSPSNGDSESTYAQQSPAAPSNFPPFIKSTGRCEEVKSVKFYSLTKNINSIKKLDEPLYWKISNNTNQTISTIVSQSNVDIFVVFLPPHGTFQTTLPGTVLSFHFRSTKDSCINWFSGLAFFSEMPAMEQQGIIANPYKNAIFETITLNSGSQVKARTTLLGYAGE